jgi:sucrose-6F-phosphate phosphohydrolase
MPSEPQLDEPSPEHWLLVSDVDDTLIGDDEALATFLDLARRSDHLTVAVNSSRPHDSVMATLRNLPDGFMPKAVITALGTEVFVDGELLESWHSRFHGFDRRPIDEAMQKLGLQPHADEMQTPLKASFSVPRGVPSDLALEALEKLPVALRTIVSHGGVDLDVIPREAGKGVATLHLAERLGVPMRQLVVAGDSANDVLMFNAVEKAIAVGNAREELLRVADPVKTYFAKGCCAAGIIEGLRHYGAPLAHAKANSEANSSEQIQVTKE